MTIRCAVCVSSCAIFFADSLGVAAPVGVDQESGPLLTGKAAMGDWTTDAPGVRRKITIDDLPPTGSNILAINPPRVVKPPADAQLHVPPGFKIDMYASGFRDPRFLLTAPNGGIFVTESRANQIKVLRDTKGSGKPDVTEIFAEHDLNKPFGIAFYPPGNDPQFVYVAIPITPRKPIARASSSSIPTARTGTFMHGASATPSGSHFAPAVMSCG
jgi:glucose/arabinose dehydrogenase